MSESQRKMILKQNALPTPYSDVNAILELLLIRVQAVLQGQFVGMYLYGSLASGDFNPYSSDVDFLVVTTHDLPAKTFTALAQMHTDIINSGLKFAPKLEGSYIPIHALRRFVPNDTPRPTLNEGKFYWDSHGYDWVIQRHIIREQGVIVAGPDPKPMIDPVMPQELRQAILEILRGWWRPMLDDQSFLQRSAYQVFAILSMCRIQHGLYFGTIVSKPVAAAWVQTELGEYWAGIIEDALQWRPGVEFNHLDEAVEMIRLTVTFALSKFG